MECKRCHRQMDMVRFVSHGGRDGSVSEWVYRCVKCWSEATVRESRKAA